MSKTIEKRCLCCDVVFTASLKEHNRGNAKYCSLKCSARTNAKMRSDSIQDNLVCCTCGTSFSRSPSKMKNSKTGYFFCSRVCKDLAQRVGTALSIPDIQPVGYGNGATEYRERALREYGCKCQDCGYDRYPALIQVHHIDRDRTNGSLENLRVLCIRCHMEDHFDAGDGPFIRSYHKAIDIDD